MTVISRDTVFTRNACQRLCVLITHRYRRPSSADAAAHAGTT
ncbi:hypothetical protein [Escherichia coli]